MFSPIEWLDMIDLIEEAIADSRYMVGTSHVDDNGQGTWVLIEKVVETNNEAE